MAWSDLPVELLGCIYSLLPVVDCIRLIAVYTSWNSALANNAGQYHVLQIRCPSPSWLLLPSNAEEASDTLTFRDLSIKEGCGGSHRHFSSLDSHIYGRRCIGFKDGWLVTLDEIDLQPCLFNPITKSEISLPCLYTIPGDQWQKIKRDYAPDGSVECFIDRYYDHYSKEGKPFLEGYFQNIVLSSNDPFGTTLVMYDYVCGV